jgi:Cys-rich protein (TIGR01571 family)
MRQKHGIEGSTISDLLLAYCCTCCVMVQIAREEKEAETTA